MVTIASPANAAEGGGTIGDITLGSNGQVTVSNLNIASVNNFNQVVNNNLGERDYLISGKGRQDGISAYSVVSSANADSLSDTDMVANFEAMKDADSTTSLDGYKNTFGIIDFIETEDETDGEFRASNGIVAPFFAAVSDARLKNNVRPIDGALERLLRLTGYRYNLKPLASSSEQQSAGVMAQEVREVLPEAVFEDKKTSRLAVNYNALVPLLIESIKELSHKVRRPPNPTVE